MNLANLPDRVDRAPCAPPNPSLARNCSVKFRKLIITRRFVRSRILRTSIFLFLWVKFDLLLKCVKFQGIDLESYFAT